MAAMPERSLLPDDSAVPMAGKSLAAGQSQLGVALGLWLARELAILVLGYDTPIFEPLETRAWKKPYWGKLINWGKLIRFTDGYTLGWEAPSQFRDYGTWISSLILPNVQDLDVHEIWLEIGGERKSTVGAWEPIPDTESGHRVLVEIAWLDRSVPNPIGESYDGFIIEGRYSSVSLESSGVDTLIYHEPCLSSRFPAPFGTDGLYVGDIVGTRFDPCTRSVSYRIIRPWDAQIEQEWVTLAAAGNHPASQYCCGIGMTSVQEDFRPRVSILPR